MNPLRRRRLGGTPVFSAPDPGNLIGWWEADFGTFTDTGLTTPTTSDGATVAGWQNKVSGGTNATNATAPVLKLGIFGSKPALLFTIASSQVLVADALGSVASGTNVPVSFIAVAKVAGTVGNQDIASFGRLATGNPFIGAGASATNWIGNRRDDTGANLLTITGATLTAGQGVFYACRFDGSLGYLQVNGVDQAPTSLAAGSVTTDEFAIGALRRANANSNFFGGHIADLAVYKSMVTDGQLRSWRNYLGAKYGVPA